MAEVVWSQHAIDLADIVLQETKEIYGAKALERIINRIELLQQRVAKMPRIGGYEEALADEEGEYRFLTINNRFKLVYEVVDDSNVLIIAIWDFKQNPDKLRYFI